MIPDNVEKIIMTKEDYDRNVEQLLLEKINAEQEIERLNNIIKQIYEIFKEGRFEDDCDCIQIEELITRELKGSDKE